jgi:hypothetical protein
MATIVTTTYGTATALTITLASLASSATAGVQSTAVDNTTNQFVDAIVGGKIRAGTTPTINTQIEVWVYASYDGTTYAPNGITGTNGAVTPAQLSKNYMRLGQVLPTTVATTGYDHQFVLPSLMTLFGFMPIKWGVWVTHNSVAALDASGANHEIKYVGLKYTST